MADATIRNAAYDAATKWTQFPDWRDAVIERQGWVAKPVSDLQQTLVSGRIDLANKTLCPQTKEVGLWNIADTQSAFVRIARDRALIVSQHPIAFNPGWNSQGWAVTAADDTWIVFEIVGPDLRALCAEATSANLEAGSASAALSFAGIVCLLYRTTETTARLHVERSLAPFIWRWLETRPEPTA
jgi:hypothetical protein